MTDRPNKPPRLPTAADVDGLERLKRPNEKQQEEIDALRKAIAKAQA